MKSLTMRAMAQRLVKMAKKMMRIYRHWNQAKLVIVPLRRCQGHA
jgi:hypothetical protein